MQSIEQIQQSLIEDFSLFDAWDDKYEYIIEMGRKLSPMSEEGKTNENKIKGCQSSVWLTAQLNNDGLIHFEADSDSVIVKGLVSLLLKVLNHQTPKDIYESNLDFIDTIGLSSHLAQTRSNGLLAMVKQMKFYAMAFMAKQGHEVR